MFDFLLKKAFNLVSSPMGRLLRDPAAVTEFHRQRQCGEYTPIKLESGEVVMWEDELSNFTPNYANTFYGRFRRALTGA